MSVNNSNCWSDYDTFGLRTVNQIIIDDYKTLNILHDNGTKHTVDISNLSGAYYVGVGMTYYQSTTLYGYFGLWTPTSGTYEQAAAKVSIGYHNPETVQRIWLEK